MNNKTELEYEMENNPVKASLMFLASLHEKELKQKELEQKHQPTKHDSGFHLTFETPNGFVGLWSCWLEDQLYIGYPYDWDVPDDLIRDTLGVVDSTPVYHEEFVSSNYNRPSTRVWAKFFGNRLNEGGRVWVDHSNRNSNGRHFPIIQNKKLKELYYGHSESMSICTTPFSFFNEKEIDAPSAKKDAIQAYRDKFIQLAINIANLNGGITAVHVKYEFTLLTPELLDVMGYTNVQYVKGEVGYYDSFGGTVIFATKDDEEIILKSANSLVPWVNIRKIPVKGKVTVEDVLNRFLVF